MTNSITQASLRFFGNTFDPAQDGKRLTRQVDRVFDLMRDGNWRTLAEIAKHVPGTETALSARLRGFRHPRNGGHTVERKRVEGCSGLWAYRLVV
jgi:hypothetical protein